MRHRRLYVAGNRHLCYVLGCSLCVRHLVPISCLRGTKLQCADLGNAQQKVRKRRMDNLKLDLFMNNVNNPVTAFPTLEEAALVFHRELHE